MKTKITLLLGCILLTYSSVAQNLRTIRTYYDPLSGTMLSEIYTVIQNTPTKHGSYKSYMRDGTLALTATYKNNKLNGAKVTYGVNCGWGQDNFHRIRSRENYLNGELHGTQTTYEMTRAYGATERKYQILDQDVYNNGEQISEINYYDNGKKRNSYKKNGSCTEWHYNGTVKQEFTRKNGKPEGVATSYLEDGSINLKVTYLNGKAQGESTEYYSNGQVKLTKEYNQGVIVGKSTEFFSNGVLSAENNYGERERIISQTIYATNGKKAEQYKFFKDNLYHVAVYDTISGRVIREMEEWNSRNSSRSKDIEYKENGDKIVTTYDGMGGSTKEVFNKDGVALVPKDNTKDNVTESAVKHEEVNSNGDRFTYYDNGNIKSKRINEGEVFFGKTVSLLGETHKVGETINVMAVIEYYEKGSVKSKGYMNLDTDSKTGKWYYYNPNGELILVEEDGEKAKIKGSDKKEHVSFLKEHL